VSAVLLDTCAILWLAAGLAPRDGVMALIEAARADDAALVSPISAWEIAQKEKRRPGSLGLAAPPLAVFERLAGQPGVRMAPLTPAILRSIG
jgi:PIN domain nuclease of toxin-antitoxin system